MAFLLVDLHRNGVFWGDCSLANTLFRRDGDRIQAYLVDAETSEVHPTLSDGQRAYDLEILVENVAFGLADLAAMQDAPRPRTTRSPPPSASAIATEQVWTEHPRRAGPAGRRPPGDPGPRPRLNDLGYSVDLDLDPTAGDGRRPAADARHDPPLPRPRARAADADPGPRGPGPAAAQRPQRVRAPGSSGTRGRPVPPEEAADRWLHDVYRPTLARIAGAVGPERDLVQAYCDVLEQKWFLSEAAGRDVGLDRGDRRLPGARGARAGDARGRAGRTRSIRRRSTARAARSSRDDDPDGADRLGRRRPSPDRDAVSACDVAPSRRVTTTSDRRRGARHPRRGPAQALRRDARRRRGQLRGPARDDLRAARAERRRQDDDGRGPGGPPRARRAARSGSSAIDAVRDADAAQGPDRRLAPDGRALPEAHRRSRSSTCSGRSTRRAARPTS